MAWSDWTAFYLASVALGRLVALMRKVHSAGGRLALCKVSRTMEELLRVSHLADILLAYDDEQEAVRSSADLLPIRKLWRRGSVVASWRRGCWT